MSGDSNSSGDEGALYIDTERNEKASWKGGAKGKKNGLQDAGRVLPKPGEVVWAKVPGFTFWPAKVFDAINDDIVPVWLKGTPKPSYMLVRFFGTYDMLWVSPNAIETYNSGLDKRYELRSKSKIFQKAVKEVFGYMEDFVLPLGLTLIPPYPVNAGMAGVIIEGGVVKQVPLPCPATTAPSKPSEVKCNNPAPRNGSTNVKGSSRRKTSTPRRLSSSSSESLAKRPRLSSAGQGEEERKLPSPEIQAFTCAPLPLIKPTELVKPPTTET